MCVTSMVMDHYREKWQELIQPTWVIPNIQPAITDAEIVEFRKLLERAREYDKRTGQADCELDEKREAITHIAKQLGVEVSFT